MKLNTPGRRAAKNNVPLAARALQSALSAVPLPAAIWAPLPVPASPGRAGRPGTQRPAALGEDTGQEGGRWAGTVPVGPGAQGREQSSTHRSACGCRDGEELAEVTPKRQAGGSGRAVPGTRLVMTWSCSHRTSPPRHGETRARLQRAHLRGGYGEDAAPTLSIKPGRMSGGGVRDGEKTPSSSSAKHRGCPRGTHAAFRCPQQTPAEHGGHQARPHRPPPAPVQQQDPQRTASPQNTSQVTTALPETRDKGLVPKQGLQEERDGDGRVSQVTCPQPEPRLLPQRRRSER